MRGIVGIPHTGYIPAATVESLLALRKVKGVELVFLSQTIIHIARELIVQKAITEKYDWVLFIDSDMVAPENLLEVVSNYSKDKEIVSAPCYKRKPPFDPCYYKSVRIENNRVVIEGYTELFDKKQRFVEVEGVGGACLFIRTSAFAKMKAPYFYPLPTTGEDISFCIRAKQGGVKMWIDTSLRVGHISAEPIYEEHFRGWAK